MNPLANFFLSYSVFRYTSHLDFQRGPIVMSLCPPWCMKSFRDGRNILTPLLMQRVCFSKWSQILSWYSYISTIFFWCLRGMVVQGVLEVFSFSAGQFSTWLGNETCYLENSVSWNTTKVPIWMFLSFDCQICHSTVTVCWRTDAHGHILGLDVVWIWDVIFPMSQFPQL